MITLRNQATGEVTITDGLGYDMALWEVVAAVLPPDDGRAHVLDGDAFVAVPLARLSALQFFARFTLAEQLAAYSSDDVRVKLTIGMVQSADYVDLEDPRVLDGLDLFVAVGILTAERVAEVLDGPLPD